MGRVLLGFVIILSMIGVTAITVRYQRELGMTRKALDSLGSQVIDTCPHRPGAKRRGEPQAALRVALPRRGVCQGALGTSCGPIEYASRGEGDPVLVIHGNGGGFDQGLGLAQSYLGQGFQVIAPSRFGYLRTPVPAKATPELQADAYACLLDHLGIQRAAVFTTSAGVTSAVQFALRHPERVTALVLHSPNAPGKVDMVLPPKFLFTTLMKSDFAWWALSTYLNTSLQSMVGVPKDFALTPQYQADVKATLASVLPISQRANGMMFDTYISNPEINRYPLGEVSTPTLVISAVDDPMALHANARGLADQIPGARLLAVPDGGHLLLGHTEEVKAEIVQFLDQTVAEMTNNH